MPKQEKPKCPYNCPYSPSNEDSPAEDEPIKTRDIKTSVECDQMSIVTRDSDYEGDVHVCRLWDTDFGWKVGVESKPEYADLFEQLDWDVSHHKWSTERTEDTDMWEVDLDSVPYVAMLFASEGVDVTLSDEVCEAYRKHSEDIELQSE